MKTPELEVLMCELIKEKPDLEVIRREAKKVGLRVAGRDLTSIMAQVLEKTASTTQKKSKINREVAP